ncbi:hypothetical protein CEQ21_04120 [Niallia circulans]|uniref:Uncharacterized protein n=1 Tax=Niallia circulans TaxID=1397 RepID=A0A553ST21_NIACI|nr:hypothetical protein [Niallia circulans]TRZ40134.1 hypothetical protein CEQ21_04120 [Niallia circulans]
MLEMILSGGALLASYIVFYKTNIVARWTTWKSIGLSILVILLSMLLFVFTGGKYYSIVIVPTIICAVFVTVSFQRYIISVQKMMAEKYANREV